MSSSKKPPAGKALKIRLYPNSEEKQKLLKWIGTARWTYNQSLAAINSDIKNKNKKYLRANYITNRSEKFKDPNFKWVLDTPYYIRDAAMLDLLKNYKSNVAAKKENVANFLSSRVLNQVNKYPKRWNMTVALQ